MKRLISMVIALSMILSLFTAVPVQAADAVSDTSVFVKQSKSGRCTLASAVMMLRRRAYLEGNSNWSSITESSTLSDAWSSGLNWDFTYAGIRVVKGSFSKMTQGQKKSKLISLLGDHPEGVVIYMYGDGRKTHAVLATDYDSYTDTIYCADPANSIAKGRIPLTSAYLTGSTQDERIGNLRMYWYVKSGNCTLKAPEPEPVQHSHSYNYTYESSHPHSEYKYCSCGDKEYTGSKQLISSCSECYPVGNVSLKCSYQKTKGTATFYRNNVTNANSYELKLYKNGSLEKTYTMSSDEKYVSGLSSGEFYAVIEAKNTSTGEIRKDTSKTFKISDTYNVSFNANGGTNVPDVQTKIEDTPLTLTTDIPKRTGYVFKGWATSKNSLSAKYQPGESYTKNAKITLYAVWEPEIYNVTFDANGGTGELENVTVTYGNTVRMPNSILKDGYYLKGWSTNKNAATPEYRVGKDYKLTADTNLYAIWGNSTWGGDVAFSFVGGDGTKENPYQISNAGELAYLAKLVNSQTSSPVYQYYVLTDNIDLNYESWMPIGIGENNYQYFYGDFDGCGYTVSGIYITDGDYDYYGLFGKGHSSNIKNITIKGDIEGIKNNETTYVGGLVGGQSGGRIENVNVAYFDISNISISNYRKLFVGGILGGTASTSSCTIKNCKVENSLISVRLQSSEGYIGGIAGSGSYIYVENCILDNDDVIFGKLEADTDSTIRIGGIIGLTGYGRVNNCHINASRLADKSIIDGFVYAGGISAGCDVENSSVKFTDKEIISFDGKQIPYSIYFEASGGRIAGLTVSGSNVKNSKYDGASILIFAKNYNYAPTYSVAAGITTMVSSRGYIENVVCNVDGIIYVKSDAANTFAGGFMCFNSFYSQTIKNSMVIADEIKAVNYSTNIANTEILAGDVVSGRIKSDDVIEKVYVNSDMALNAIKSTTLSSTCKTYSNAVTKSYAKLKSESFQKSLLGLKEYQSLKNLATDSTAVWVLNDGELPELYYNCLNDITISKDIENGVITADKTQAVDGEIVTVTALPSENYVLNKIYVNGEEIVGSTFEMSGDSEIFATFTEKVAEYEVSITANENATGSLINADASDIVLMSMVETGETSLTANDGEEIQVNAVADSEYTVDSIYVNGEEIVGNNFIVNENSVVTMEVSSISTDIEATTYDAEDVGSYFAVVGGSVSGDSEEITKYIRYWKESEPEKIYTSEAEEGTGEFEIVLMDLEAETTYCYQMTETGEIKSFTTCEEPVDEYIPEDDETEEIIPLTTTTYKKLTATYKLSIESSEALETELLIAAVYTADDELIAMKEIECDGDTSYTASFPINSEISYAKIFVWNKFDTLMPLAGAEKVEITN